MSQNLHKKSSCQGGQQRQLNKETLQQQNTQNSKNLKHKNVTKDNNNNLSIPLKKIYRNVKRRENRKKRQLRPDCYYYF